jgi:hypothetical protein
MILKQAEESGGRIQGEGPEASGPFTPRRGQSLVDRQEDICRDTVLFTPGCTNKIG